MLRGKSSRFPYTRQGVGVESSGLCRPSTSLGSSRAEHARLAVETTKKKLQCRANRESRNAGLQGDLCVGNCEDAGASGPEAVLEARRRGSQM